MKFGILYALHGFPGFQAWTYECILILGRLCGTRVNNSLPRLLNWMSTSVTQFEQLEKTSLVANTLTVLKFLRPTLDEERQSYWTSLFETRKMSQDDSTDVDEGVEKEELIDHMLKFERVEDEAVHELREVDTFRIGLFMECTTNRMSWRRTSI